MRGHVWVERISRGRGDLAQSAFDRDWSSWRGCSIEPVVRDAVQRLALRDERLAAVEDVRPWWRRDGSVEVDAVAMARDHTVMIGSIKWRAAHGVTEREITHLEAARVLIPHS